MDETQEYGDGQEESTQAEDTATSNERYAEVDELKSELAQIKSLLLEKNAPSKKEESAISQAMLDKFKADPSALADFLHQQTLAAKTEIKKEAAKQTWDRKAEEKFPLIKTNKDFQKKVASQIRELTSTGEYSHEDPMLVYRAAQLVSSEYVQSKRVDSSSDDRSFASSAEARTSVSRDVSRNQNKVTDNDPRLQFAKVLGIKGEKLEKFKSSLGPYVAPQRKQGRRLMK